jgi:hypothetical protein
MSLPSLTEFASLLGQPFMLDAGLSEPLPARLVAAQALDMAPHAGRQPFSLLFAGPPRPQLPQRTYRLAHPKLPALDIFLVPVGADAEATRYQAVFT